MLSPLLPRFWRDYRGALVHHTPFLTLQLLPGQQTTYGAVKDGKKKKKKKRRDTELFGNW